LNLRPNVVTYNAVVDVCCKCGDLNRADATVHLMRSEGHLPDSITFNMIINAACKSQQNDRVFACLDMMRSLRVMPNAGTFHALQTNFTGDRQALEQALLPLQGTHPMGQQPMSS